MSVNTIAVKGAHIRSHGGGPTRENIEMVHQLDKAKDFPAIKFTTASAFFEKLSREMDGRPTQRGEMQYIFEGCYSNVAENKEGNRNCENALYGSEFFNTLRWVNGDVYPATELRDIWKTVAFNQFHADLMKGGTLELVMGNRPNKQWGTSAESIPPSYEMKN